MTTGGSRAARASRLNHRRLPFQGELEHAERAGEVDSLASPVVLKLVLPKGSLERATFELFEAADLTVIRSSAVDYRATIDDPRIDDVRILRPQEIPTLRGRRACSTSASPAATGWRRPAPTS